MEFNVGDTGRLREGAKSTGSFELGASRFIVNSGLDHDGEVQVKLLDGPREGCSHWILPDQIASLDSKTITKDPEVGQEYELIDGARAYSSDSYGTSRRVRITERKDWDGDCRVRLLDGDHKDQLLYFKPSQFKPLADSAATPDPSRLVGRRATITMDKPYHAHLYKGDVVEFVVEPDGLGRPQCKFISGKGEGYQNWWLEPGQWELIPLAGEFAIPTAESTESVDVFAMLAQMGG